MKLNDIKVIVWDFDNTLYDRIEGLTKDVREAELTVIMNHTGWDHEKAAKQFMAVYRRIYFSATQAAAQLSGISFQEAAIEMENYFDRTKYLVRDEKLIEMFTRLYGYKHMILTNGLISKIKQSLSVLGISPELFELIGSSEITGTNKPDPQAFTFMIGKTGFAAASCLMVGDRDEVDIIPAKAAGMKTCFVWGKSRIADLSLPRVYDLPGYLG